MTFSTCVVYNICCLGTFNFLESKAITQCRSAIFSQFRSFTGTSNARFDGMVETSMTFSTCVVYNIWCLGTFNFLESKAITQCRSAIFFSVSIKLNFFFSSFTGASNARFDGMV